MVFKIFTIILLVFFCVLGLTSIEIADEDRLWNATDAALINAYNTSAQDFQIDVNATGLGEIIINIVYKMVDATIYVMLQVARIAGRVAIENPQINFKLMLNLIFFILILLVVVPFTKLVVIISILIIDIFKHFKEKRELRNLKDANNKIR